MTIRAMIITIIGFAAACLAAIPFPAAGAGLLKPVNHDLNTVEMKTHKVSVIINNGFARTEVDQVFVNTGSTDLEAIYTFPVPQNASLSELSLWINGTEVVGEVLERASAKKVYEDQKARGNATALAEKNGYKTFDVRVYPVAAGADTRVRLVYYQPLEIDLNVGRYVYPLAEGNVDDDRIAFWETDTRVNQAFTFHAVLKSAFPVRDVRLPGFQDQAVIQARNHDKDVPEQSAYDIRLDTAEGKDLDRDIVLYYRLDDHTPARVELVPFKAPGADEGRFMLVVTPGADLQPISQGADWTFVLDVSGSMGGAKISTLSRGVKKSIKKMTPGHRFRIITFNDKARLITPGFIDATPDNVNQANAFLDGLAANGSTNLHHGLETAYDGLDSDRIHGIILVTDGVANVGPATHSRIMALHRQHDVRLFTFVVGNSANQPLLQDLAKDSGGFAMHLSSQDDLVGRILQAGRKMAHQSLYDTKIRVSGESVTQLLPSSLGNLYLGQQIVMFGRYSAPGTVGIELTGKIDGQKRSWTTRARLPEMDLDNPEIERLWAMAAIREKMEKIRTSGETRELKQAVVDLGTAYSLVTDYTAMVVLAGQEMEKLGIKPQNAGRVQTERNALKKKAKAPVVNYRIGKDDPSGQMFGTAPSPGIGTGAVGPFFVGLICLIRRFKNSRN